MLVESAYRYNVISVERTHFIDPHMCQHHLHLPIDDIDDSHIEAFDAALKERGLVYPEKEHIETTINFDKEHPVNIIHCHAGISRSPAIGYAILRARGLGSKEAMELVMQIAPFALPNKRIVRLTNEMFPE
jgi:predicted protein tyrosine phosphatase